MKVLSAAQKSERIKIHQRNFYTRIQKNMQCNGRALWTRSESQKGGHQNQVLASHSLPWDQTWFQVPPDSPQGGRPYRRA
ncbi:hypothetical protein M9H77_35438 [Catharanthus roseus]|uniref:Uncharacterized protein n=1 Tax=Catharanthus roseus TaxID=4058 RepID=A0ACB9ZQW8_CATRO|nr:hypothetical protein M9H77_35438 [Catharanthus roseus]